MSNLNLTPQWHDSINQVETGDDIVGGANGVANKATKQLAENILFIKQLVEKSQIKIGEFFHTTHHYADSDAVAARHGYGTWSRYAEGRALVGHSTKSSDPDDYKTMGNEFGENEHTLTVEEIPSHEHDYSLSTNISGSGYPATGSTDNNPGSKKTGRTGGGQPHNIIQPVKVVGCWIRTA